MPPLPPQFINYLGMGVLILIGLAISTTLQEWIKKVIRNGKGDRRNGDDRWFAKMMELHDQFTTHMKLANEHREKTNEILQKMIETGFDRHQSVKEDLLIIKRAVNGR